MTTKHPRLKVTLPHMERIFLRAIQLRATARQARAAGEEEAARVPEAECIRQMIRDTARVAQLSVDELKAAKADLDRDGHYAPLD